MTTPSTETDLTYVLSITLFISNYQLTYNQEYILKIAICSSDLLPTICTAFKI